MKFGAGSQEPPARTINGIEYRQHSNQYQWKLVENTTDFSLFSEKEELSLAKESIEERIIQEEIIEIRAKILKEVLKIIDKKLSERQKEIVGLWLSGITQKEIANKLKIQQTSINKCLFGQAIYKDKKLVTKYGGAIKKIKEYCLKSSKIKELFEEIAAIDAT